MADHATAPTARPRRTFGDVREATEFVGMLEKFERGEINSEAYRQFRLSRGVYGQRQEEQHMIRVKIPQGVLSSAQLRTLAEVADRFSRGYGHVTTRQNLQFHGVRPADLGALLTQIAESGLTTREACSHTVRNVTGCPYAGVCNDTPFDVTPYAELVTRHFLRGPLGSGLPRKFKIAVSGCASDCANGAINDIGLIASVRDGQRGFRLLAGGGTATLAKSGGVLAEFLPVDELLAACEAIVRVFNLEGERNNPAKARMKWIIRRLGWEGFQALFQQQLEAIRADGGRPLPLDAALDGEQPPSPPRVEPLADATPSFTTWQARSLRPQVQPGFSTALVWLRLGDISAVQLRGLADLVDTLGDGTVRTTQSQNLLVRWVRDSHVGNLWHGLQALGLGDAHAEDLSDVVSCPGAETCRIAVTASRGVGQLLSEHLRSAVHGPRTSGADIKVSGCPNGCAQHHIATIGLQGGVRKVGGDLVPLYHLTIGGGVGVNGATFGRLVGKIPARRVPLAVDRLLAHHQAHAQPNEGLRDYLQRLDLNTAKAILADLAEVDEATARPEDFIDLGSSVKFEVVAMDGECAQ